MMHSTASALSPISGECQDQWYTALLGFAEHFRISNPPNINHCIHCLQSIFQFKPSPRIEARTHLQIGAIIYKYTDNRELAGAFLDKAVTLSRPIPSFEEVSFESTCLLAEVFSDLGNKNVSKQLYQTLLSQFSVNSPWYLRVSLEYAKLLMSLKETENVLHILRNACKIAEGQNDQYMRIIMMICEGMVLLQDHKYSAIQDVLTTAGSMLRTYQGNDVDKELAISYFLTLQVCHLVGACQLENVKFPLKSLQESLRKLYSIEKNYSNDGASVIIPRLHWISVNELCVLVYLLTAMFCLLSGELPNVLKFTEKAFNQIRDCEFTDRKAYLHKQSHVVNDRLYVHFKMILYEINAQTLLVMGRKSTALNCIVDMVTNLKELTTNSLYQRVGNDLAQRHISQIHILLGLFFKVNIVTCPLALVSPGLRIVFEYYTRLISKCLHVCLFICLGLYTMLMNQMNLSESQFNAAKQQTQRTDLHLFINLNLAMLFSRDPIQRFRDLFALQDRIEPKRVSELSVGLKSSALAVKGLGSMNARNFNEAKLYLSEALKLSNQNELPRLSCMALTLLSFLFLTFGNPEVLDMANSANTIAVTLHDASLLLWTCAILRDAYKMSNNQLAEQQFCHKHVQISDEVVTEHKAALENVNHQVLSVWIQGPPPTDLVPTSSKK